MVTITNGEKSFRVSAGAVSVYESMGFHVASDDEVEEVAAEPVEQDSKQKKPYSKPVLEEVPEVESETEEEEPEDTFIEDLLEKPLSNWSNDEIKEFVRRKGIDTSGAQKLSHVRGIIKNYLDEQAKKQIV